MKTTSATVYSPSDKYEYIVGKEDPEHKFGMVTRILGADEDASFDWIQITFEDGTSIAYDGIPFSIVVTPSQEKPTSPST